MLRRAIQLLRSNWGRDFGWRVELDGRDVGELIDPVTVDMFWDSYAARPVSPETASDFMNPAFWIGCYFQFRNQATGEHAPHAFCGGEGRIVEGRITMRGLYLVPSSRWEALQVRCLAPFMGRRGRNVDCRSIKSLQPGPRSGEPMEQEHAETAEPGGAN